MTKAILIEGLFCAKCASEKIRKMAPDISQPKRQRFVCTVCKSTAKPLTGKPQILPKFKKTKAQRYIITSAVNDTSINYKQLETYEVMAELLDARLIIIGTVYKNPDMTHGFGGIQWPEEVLPYICQDRFEINKNLTIRGDWRIEHCVVNPLAGANHCGGTVCEIFGHPQVAMEIVPTPKNSIPKGMWTTGTISEPNYGGSSRAKKAEFHHNFNAMLIEVQGSKFWPTQLPWDGVGVQLFNTYYTPKGFKKAPRIAAGVYGDVHFDSQTKAEKTLLAQAIRTINAEKNVLHDLLDFHSGSHHKKGKVLENLRRPDIDVRGELDRTVAYLASVQNAVVVSSNHNDHLDQWFDSFKPQQEVMNLDLYYELGELARRTQCGLFQAYCESKGITADFTHPNIEYDIGGRDLSQHGHKGPNGSRGSARGFSRTGRKTTIGHSHTPRIDKGCRQVGTSALELGYAQGYSSWVIAHDLIYSTGKCAMIFAIDKKFSPLFLTGGKL